MEFADINWAADMPLLPIINSVGAYCLPLLAVYSITVYLHMFLIQRQTDKKSILDRVMQLHCSKLSCVEQTESRSYNTGFLYRNQHSKIPKLQICRKSL